MKPHTLAARALLLLAACCTTMAVARAATEAERVDIPPAGFSSSPTPLVGRLFVPEKGQPRGAVVMLHGCGGAYGRSGGLGPRHQMWGEYLSGLGYAALMVDSFTSRGLREICTIRFADRPIKEADRVGDAYAALAYLESRLGLRPPAIGLLGWSHGGGTVLAAISATRPAESRFAAAVSFYPGCSSRAKRVDAFHPYAPTLLIIGEADDWTPAEPCKRLAASVSERGEPLSIVTYPDTYHDFDNPGISKLNVRREVPNGVRPGSGVTVAPNPQAREDAKLRVRAFFEANLRR